MWLCSWCGTYTIAFIATFAIFFYIFFYEFSIKKFAKFFKKNIVVFIHHIRSFNFWCTLMYTLQHHNHNRVCYDIQYWIDQYLQYLEYYKSRSSSTLHNNYIALIDFKNSLHQYDVRKLTTDEIERWVTILRRRPTPATSRYKNTTLNSNTISAYLSCVRWLFRYIAKKDIKTIHPDAIESVPWAVSKIEALTNNEILELFAVPANHEIKQITQVRNELFLKLMMYSGGRLAEVLSLKDADILNATNHQVPIIGKGGKLWSLMITDEIVELTKKYCQMKKQPLTFWENNDRVVYNTYNDDALFVSHSEVYYGKKAHKSVFQSMFKTYREVLWWDKPLSAHILRHSFCTQLLKNGVDIRIASKLMRHEDIRTTMWYSHVDDSMLQEAHKKLIIS